MIIDKEIWKKIKENIDNLYWDEDRMSRDGIYFLKQLDNLVEKAEKENNLKVYVIECHGVNNDEIFKNIVLVTPSKNYAKKVLKQEIKDIKTDYDFDQMDAIDITDKNINLNDIEYDEKWIYEEDEDSFSIFLNGEYNSYNCSISIEEHTLALGEVEKEKEVS